MSDAQPLDHQVLSPAFRNWVKKEQHNAKRQRDLDIKRKRRQS